jgi:hypothetical protein
MSEQEHEHSHAHTHQSHEAIIQDHIDHCLEDTVSALNNGERAPLEAFKQITKYL